MQNNDEVNFVKRDDRKKGIDLNAILVNLTEEKLSPQHPTSPPKLCSDTSPSNNSSDCFNKQVSLDEDADGELLQILDDLLNLSEGSESRSQGIKEQVNESFQNSHTTSGSGLTGYFCSETIFNLSHRMLTDAEIKVLEEGLDFATIQRKINEPELKQDFNDFCRMRLKWYFRDETQEFSETPAFSTKSTWYPPKGHPCLEVFLSQVENELFEITKQDLRYSNLSKEEWRAIKSLADDRSIVIKKADKALCVVVWDRNDYILQAEKQLSNTSVYRDVSNSENILSKLSEASNKTFSSLRRKGFITEKQFKYFTYEFKKTTNFGKLYLLPKIQKRLFDVPGRPVISNCGGTPTEKCSEFLDTRMKKSHTCEEGAAHLSLAFIDELEKQLFIKKTVEVSQ